MMALIFLRVSSSSDFFMSSLLPFYTPLTITPPLYERGGGVYIERGLGRGEDGNDTAMFVHRGLHNTLIDGKTEHFVIILRMLDTTQFHHLVL